MQLSPPKNITFWIAVVLAVAGLLGFLGVVSALSAYAFWLAFLGFALLAAANMFEGL